jgi:hypothetical protein
MGEMSSSCSIPTYPPPPPPPPPLRPTPSTPPLPGLSNVASPPPSIPACALLPTITAISSSAQTLPASFSSAQPPFIMAPSRRCPGTTMVEVPFLDDPTCLPEAPVLCTRTTAPPSSSAPRSRLGTMSPSMWALRFPHSRSLGEALEMAFSRVMSSAVLADLCASFAEPGIFPATHEPSHPKEEDRLATSDVEGEGEGAFTVSCRL